MTARLLAALEYAKQGLKIFPCKPGLKEPAINDPFGNATTDPDVIRGWFDRLGDVNIAYCPEDNGRCVADVDMKNGKDGMDAWLALPFEKPVTYTVGTPTDGYHYHYLGSLRQSVGKLGPGIDTRGIRSLALLPPSVTVAGKYTVDGEYTEIIPQSCIAPAPAWLLEWGKPLERTQLEAPDDLELDQPWNVDLARSHLASVHSKEGPWGRDDDPDTYPIAAAVKDLGISEETAVELMMEYLAEDERDWLATTVHNAYHYGQNAIGAKAYPDPEKLLAGLPPQNIEAQRQRRFTARKPSEGARLPPLEYWDDHRILPRMAAACSIIVYGPQGSHKTGVALKVMVDAVLTKGARVLYIAAEGSNGIETARLPELLKQRGLPVDAIDDRWWTVSDAPDILNDVDMAELYLDFKDFAPNLIVLDTGTRCIGAADINNTAIGTIAIKALEQLGKPWNATVLYITHPGKDEDRGAIGSKQQENQGYAVWRVEHDDNGIVRVHVEKMKDGKAGFTVPMRVKLGGIPVVYEMSIEERDLLTKGGPTHDDLRDMVWREVYPIVAAGGKIARTNHGDGPGFVVDLVRCAHKIDTTETDIKKALEELVARRQLQRGEGGGYVLATTAQAPETLQ